MLIAQHRTSRHPRSLGDMSPGPKPRRGGRKTPPDIQKQWQFHALACKAALDWKAHTDAGDLKAARKAAREAIKWEKEWRQVSLPSSFFGSTPNASA